MERLGAGLARARAHSSARARARRARPAGATAARPPAASCATPRPPRARPRAACTPRAARRAPARGSRSRSSARCSTTCSPRAAAPSAATAARRSCGATAAMARLVKSSNSSTSRAKTARGRAERGPGRGGGRGGRAPARARRGGAALPPGGGTARGRTSVAHLLLRDMRSSSARAAASEEEQGAARRARAAAADGWRDGGLCWPAVTLTFTQVAGSTVLTAALALALQTSRAARTASGAARPKCSRWRTRASSRRRAACASCAQMWGNARTSPTMVAVAHTLDTVTHRGRDDALRRARPAAGRGRRRVVSASSSSRARSRPRARPPPPPLAEARWVKAPPDGGGAARPSRPSSPPPATKAPTPTSDLRCCSRRGAGTDAERRQLDGRPGGPDGGGLVHWPRARNRYGPACVSAPRARFEAGDAAFASGSWPPSAKTTRRICFLPDTGHVDSSRALEPRARPSFFASTRSPTLYTLFASPPETPMRAFASASSRFSSARRTAFGRALEM